MSRWGGVLIALVCALSYYNTFENEFIRDDLGTVVKNAPVTEPLSLSRIFTAPYRAATPEDGLYRPLTVLTFALNHHFFGLAPTSYHAVNLLLHLLNSLLVYHLLRRLLAGDHGLVGALLFAAHPVHVEAVTSIVGRSELLSAAFALAALHLYSARRGGVGRGLALSALYLLSILSKENAAALPLALVAIDYYRGRFAWNPGYFLRTFPLLALTLAAYVAVRWSVLGAFGPDASTHYFAGKPPLTVLFTMSEVHYQYLRLLIFPLHLYVDETYQTLLGTYASALTPKVLLNLGLLAVAGLFAGVSFARRTKAGLFLALFYVLLLTVMNIVPIGALMAERFLYLPSLSFAALVDLALIGRSRLHAGVVGALVAAVVGSYIAIDLQRNLDWRNGIAMTELVVRNNPGYPQARFDLGSYYFQASRLEESVKEFEAFTQVAPDDPKGYFALGRSLEELGQTAAARRNYLEALSRDDTFGDAAVNLAILYAREGELDAARELLEQAIARDPQNALAHLNLGRLYEELGRTEDAAKARRRASELRLP